MNATPADDQPNDRLPNRGVEVNFDGLIGPTHNYAGLSRGNLASHQHRHRSSNPKQAALQGLEKMKLLGDWGIKQAVLPPLERPNLGLLRRLGFAGCDTHVIEQAHRQAPLLLAAAYSAASMWTANAATVSPSADTADNRVHFTPANLVSTLHRSIESAPPPGGMSSDECKGQPASGTPAILQKIFNDESVFAHHAPLPACLQLRDEGAANHTRLGPSYSQPGIEVFVYGESGLAHSHDKPNLYPARQTLQASQSIARLHDLEPDAVVYLQQNPRAIDSGVFHNDVVAVGHQNVFLYHSDAFLETPQAIDQIRHAYKVKCHHDLIYIEVTQQEISLTDAVATYLFNSQLVSLPESNTHSEGELETAGMALICPMECRQHNATRRVLDRIIHGDNPIRSVRFVELRQSMQNGGGPACLRLRVGMTLDQIQRAHQGVFLTHELFVALTQWVHKHYRDQLAPDDLADPRLMEESRSALDELTKILRLGPIYPFQ